MRRLGAGLKVWTLMVAVAITAVFFAETRAESAPGAAIAIVGACIACLASRRYSEAVALRQASGLTTSPLQKTGMLLASVAIATVVIGLSVIAFLIGYYGYLKIAFETTVWSHWTPYNDPGSMVTGGMIGMIFALWVAASLRRIVCKFERTKSGQPGRWLKLWSVGLVVLIGASTRPSGKLENIVRVHLVSQLAQPGHGAGTGTPGRLSGASTGLVCCLR